MPTGEGAHGAPFAYLQELRALMCVRALDATFAAMAPRCRLCDTRIRARSVLVRYGDVEWW
eukprot:4129890-Pleurochrysis_carterae.AAC.1